MKRDLSAALLFGAAFAVRPTFAHEKLYDDFHGRLISPTRWNGAGGDFWVFETKRELVKNGTGDHRLHLHMTAYSPRSDDGNGTGGIYGFYLTDHPRSIRGASYDVQVTHAVARECPGNPPAEVVTGPEFRGRFFNTQASPASQQGDVEVAVGFDRRSTDVNDDLTAAFIYQECANSDCSAHTTLGQGTFGTVKSGSTNNIGVRWDQNNHRFVFELNGKRTSSAYSVPDSSAPFEPDKEIDVAREIANCAESPRPYTSVDAYFDNIIVSR